MRVTLESQLCSGRWLMTSVNILDETCIHMRMLADRQEHGRASDVINLVLPLVSLAMMACNRPGAKVLPPPLLLLPSVHLGLPSEEYQSIPDKVKPVLPVPPGLELGRNAEAIKTLDAWDALIGRIPPDILVKADKLGLSELAVMVLEVATSHCGSESLGKGRETAIKTDPRPPSCRLAVWRYAGRNGWLPCAACPYRSSDAHDGVESVHTVAPNVCL